MSWLSPWSHVGSTLQFTELCVKVVYLPAEWPQTKYRNTARTLSFRFSRWLEKNDLNWRYCQFKASLLSLRHSLPQRYDTHTNPLHTHAPPSWAIPIQLSPTNPRTTFPFWSHLRLLSRRSLHTLDNQVDTNLIPLSCVCVWRYP